MRIRTQGIARSALGKDRSTTHVADSLARLSSAESSDLAPANRHRPLPVRGYRYWRGRGRRPGIPRAAAEAVYSPGLSFSRARGRGIKCKYPLNFYCWSGMSEYSLPSNKHRYRGSPAAVALTGVPLVVCFSTTWVAATAHRQMVVAESDLAAQAGLAI